MNTRPAANPSRLEHGGRIDRNKPLSFTFNRLTYTGYEGDTLASALIANGVMLTSRSFRYHRPRGIFSAGGEECCAVVSVGEDSGIEPNVRATEQLLYDGLVANSQNGWPTLKWDLGLVPGWLSRFLPSGFYHIKRCNSRHLLYNLIVFRSIHFYSAQFSWCINFYAF